MNFGLAFSYQFKDPDWLKKFILTSLIGMIPLLGPFYLSGWMLTIARRVASGEELPSLPDIEFGKFIKHGFLAMLVNLVYSLPAILLVTPLSILSSSIEGNNNQGALVIAVSFCFGLVIFIYSLLLALITPAALTNMIVNDRFGAAFQLGVIFKMVRIAIGPFLLCLVGVMITGFIAPLGLIACGIGVVITSTYSLSLAGHLFGQAFRAAKEQLNFAPPV